MSSKSFSSHVNHLQTEANLGVSLSKKNSVLWNAVDFLIYYLCYRGKPRSLLLLERTNYKSDMHPAQGQ